MEDAARIRAEIGDEVQAVNYSIEANLGAYREAQYPACYYHNSNTADNIVISIVASDYKSIITIKSEIQLAAFADSGFVSFAPAGTHYCWNVNSCVTRHRARRSQCCTSCAFQPDRATASSSSAESCRNFEASFRGVLQPGGMGLDSGRIRMCLSSHLFDTIDCVEHAG